MKKRFVFLAAALAAMLLTGCALRTVEEMYALPKRSEEFRELQAAIDTAMYGMTYSSPQSGENQQTVQTADLNGDGLDEYLVFAKGATEKPLQVLIFQQDETGKCRVLDTIGFNGQAFDQVEYMAFDDQPGLELVVGIQVSERVLRNVAVYSFHGGSAELLLLNSYSKMLPCQLSGDKSELMVLRPGEEETQRGMAVLYGYDKGQIVRSVETELSEHTSRIRRITTGRLQDGNNAVFVTSSSEDNTIVTDIFAMHQGVFTNISYSAESNTSVGTLLNYYVYAEDIDSDGVLELPSLISMKAATNWRDGDQKFLLRWYSMDSDGWEIDKLYTFHNYPGGWYLPLSSVWASRVTVEQSQGQYRFLLWDESYKKTQPLFTVYVFTGTDRDALAAAQGRFVLSRAEGVAYAAQLEEAAPEYGITENSLIEGFRLIRQDWQTDET